MFTGRLIEIGAARIAHNADHHMRLTVIHESSTERVGILPQGAGQALGYDRHATGPIHILEVSPRAQSDVQRLKISGTNEAQIGARLLRGRSRVVLHAHQVAPTLALQRRVRGHGCRFHSRQGARLVQHVFKEARHIRAFRVFRPRQDDIDGEHALDIEASRNRGQPDEARQKQSRGNQ